MPRPTGTTETSPRKPGGGRKPRQETGRRIKVSVNLNAEHHASLTAESAEKGMSLSDVLNERLTRLTSLLQ